MDHISTEIEFTLPKGYRDPGGTLHRKGVMRLATAGDEISSMRDHRVQNNPAYLTVIVLSRVLVRLGTLDVVPTAVIEELFVADFNYLQALYNQINGIDDETLANATGPDGGNVFPGNVEALPLQTAFTQR